MKIKFMRRLIKKHKRKIIYSCPIIFLLILSSTNILTPLEEKTPEIILTSTTTEMYEGDTFSVDLDVNTLTPINAIETSLNFPEENVSVLKLSKEDSIINLWIKEPSIKKDSHFITFSGGIIQKSGFVKRGKIAAYTFEAIHEGKIKIQIDNATLAISDGKGTLLTPKSNILTFTIEKKPVESPDLDENGKVNFEDAGLWLTHLWSPDKKKDDINGDGKINLRDMFFFF